MTQPKLAYNVRGKGRHYKHPMTGVEVPSITNVIGILDKPAIPRWAAKMVAENAWKMRASLAEMGQDECIDVLKGSPWRNSGRAADRGTSVHDYLEARALGRDLPSLTGEAATYQDGADQFLTEYRPEFVRTEFTVFGDGYAGTGDALVRIGGRLYAADYKTSKALYPEVALQLAALRYGATIVDDDGGVPMPEVDGCLGVLITPHGFEVREVDAGRDAYEAFLGCLTAWRWRKAGNPVGGLLDAPAEVVS